MKNYQIISAITLLLVFGHSNAKNPKISDQLETEISKGGTIEIYALLKNKNKIQPSQTSDRIARIQNIINQLKTNAQISQSVIKSRISTITNEHKFYWINNSFSAKLDANSIQELLTLDSVEKIYSNSTQQFKLVKQSAIESTHTPTATEWNLDMISVPQVWQQGFKGQDVIIAGQDTGYQWQHAAIKEKYAGWNGSTVDHNYHWHDAISNPIIDCFDNANNPESCDDHGHGTHTMGTMIGDDMQGNQIGVAPDAKWIGCRNMDIGAGTPSSYTECFQFFMQPTDLNGANPDTSKAPHIINNSWGCTIGEGCNQANALESVVNNVVDAGILVVVAAGNDGPGCNTINTPAAIYNKSLTIGSTTIDDEISLFSSQGGITVDGSNRIKPDLVAPGSNIRSASLGGGYVSFNGTSMAAPHVAGVAALMISANPSMAGKPKILKQVLTRTSEQKTIQQSCSGILGSQRPNNTYGWGRLNALNAVNQIKDIIYLDNFADF